MTHHNSDSILLLGFCSFCGENFQDDAARFIVGDFPSEQFCSHECSGNFLKFELWEERAVSSGPAIHRPASLFRQEQGEKL
ncbi:MAG: hypothetical protein GXP52_00640 [Deltaproteobacteria bacterium]|nr:hypothetical protein [Deltaproteobacteria bacterium]